MFVIIFFGLAIPTVALNQGKQSVKANYLQPTGVKGFIPNSCYPAEDSRKDPGIKWSPGSISSTKFYVILPNRSGMAAQLLNIYEDIASARALGRTIILPMLEDHKVYKEHSHGYHNFAQYFDIVYMESLNMVVLPPENATTLCAGVVYTNPGISNPRLERYYLKNFGLTFTPMSNVAAEVNTQTCVSQYRPNTGFPIYSDYAAYGQGYSLAAGLSNEFAYAWFTFSPSINVGAEVDLVMAEMPPAYNCMHLRRGDFKLHCGQRYMRQFIRPFGQTSCYQNEAIIRQKLDSFIDPSLPLYVATDNIDEATRLLSNKMKPRHEKDTKTAFIYGYSNQKIMFYHYHNTTQSDLTAIVDQMVCANANEFIGNRYSAFTTVINNMRIECDNAATLNFW